MHLTPHYIHFHPHPLSSQYSHSILSEPLASKDSESDRVADVGDQQELIDCSSSEVKLVVSCLVSLDVVQLVDSFEQLVLFLHDVSIFVSQRTVNDYHCMSCLNP